MRTLIVTAHPDTDSLTHHAAGWLQELLGAEEAVIAHLGQEDFDPRFTGGDRDNHLSRGQPDAAVAAEQERIDDATHLVLVFPVYWWSMPGLLKGWIDRVFIAGWAFDSDGQDRIVPGLQRLTMHLLPISGPLRSPSPGTVTVQAATATIASAISTVIQAAAPAHQRQG